MPSFLPKGVGHRLLLTLAGLLCAGCSHDNQAVKSLSAKVENLQINQGIIISNQFALNSNLTAIVARLNAMPTTKQMSDAGYYYHTNLVDVVDDKFTRLLEAIRISTRGFSILSTNLDRIEGMQLSTEESLMKIQSQSTMCEGILTNIFPNVIYMKMKLQTLH
jgi:hypothetical protein